MTGAILPVDLERLRPRLHRYCTRMVGSVLDAEDIVQDALVRALEALARPIDNPEGWLFRIAHNLAARPREPAAAAGRRRRRVLHALWAVAGMDGMAGPRRRSAGGSDPTARRG
jgi:DNA-directed RNA polymerase specialized sigma24 family protein